MTLPTRIKRLCREDGDCLLWDRATDDRGVPRLTLSESGKTKTVQPRRVLWEDENGVIPQGLYVTLNCGNRLCLNLAHMELITKGEVVSRAARQPDTQARRRLAGLKQRERNAVLDMQKARYIRESDKTLAELAQELGACPKTVSLARRGERWVEQSNPFAGLGG